MIYIEKKLYHVYAVESEEFPWNGKKASDYFFYAENPRQALEYMIYFKCLSAKHNYEIKESEHGYFIVLGDRALWWVQKEVML